MKLTKGEDGFLRDDKGTVHAYPDPGSSVDSTDRCGVGAFSLPPGVGECKFHDGAYKNPYYQATHTRKEADEILRRLNPGLLGAVFYRLSRWFGGSYWEDRRTR